MLCSLTRLPGPLPDRGGSADPVIAPGALLFNAVLSLGVACRSSTAFHHDLYALPVGLPNGQLGEATGCPSPRLRQMLSRADAPDWRQRSSPTSTSSSPSRRRPSSRSLRFSTVRASLMHQYAVDVTPRCAGSNAWGMFNLLRTGTSKLDCARLFSALPAQLLSALNDEQDHSAMSNSRAARIFIDTAALAAPGVRRASADFQACTSFQRRHKPGRRRPNSRKHLEAG